MTMFEISFDQWNVDVKVGGLPEIYNHYISHAALVEEIDIKGSDGEACFIAVSRNNGPRSADKSWPEVVIAQRYEPFQAGFHPGVLIAPETSTLFVGAGTRLLAYDLSKPARLWEDYADCGFWCWRQHGCFVLMSAEIEFAAWTDKGEKLWSTFVEPPWSYVVDGGRVELDVMGKLSRFEISEGPAGPPSAPAAGGASPA